MHAIHLTAHHAVRRIAVVHARTHWTLVAVVLSVSILAACREERVPSTATPIPRATEGAPRGYHLGFSAVPPSLSDAGYQAAFDLAGSYADVLLIQRAPSWADFLPGATPSERLRATTASEREAARQRGLQLFLALDPFDPAARERLANPPPGLEERDLGDPALRQAFVAEAKYLALNYRPAYMALGMEVNSTYEREPAQYQRFAEAYREAYIAVKSVSPQTKVFVTFQFEQLMGVIPWDPPHAPRWELLDDFTGRLDVFAITSYPSFTYSVARKVPPEYYRQIREHTQLPIAFAAVGFSSAPGREGVNSSTAPEQRRFLQRLLADAEDLSSPLVVWFIGRDASYLKVQPYDLVAAIGLRDLEGAPKEAWMLWEEAARRPYDPVAAAARARAAEGTPARAQ